MINLSGVNYGKKTTRYYEKEDQIETLQYENRAKM